MLFSIATVLNANITMAELQGKKSCTCSECGKCCPFPCNLVRDMIIHYDERPYSCTECGKCFKAVKVLKEHMNTEKWYTCTECGKCFSLDKGLTNNTKIHTGENHTLAQNVENVF